MNVAESSHCYLEGGLPGGRHFLDPCNQRAFVDYEVDAIDVRQSIDRTLGSGFVCGSQPNFPKGRLVNVGYTVCSQTAHAC
jgi:hypothetical protein